MICTAIFPVYKIFTLSTLYRIYVTIDKCFGVLANTLDS